MFLDSYLAKNLVPSFAPGRLKYTQLPSKFGRPAVPQHCIMQETYLVILFCSDTLIDNYRCLWFIKKNGKLIHQQLTNEVNLV